MVQEPGQDASWMPHREGVSGMSNQEKTMRQTQDTLDYIIWLVYECQCPPGRAGGDGSREGGLGVSA